MLINAQRAEELRLAIVSDGVLDEYEISAAESGLCRGNIYRGIVANVQPSLNAAFIEIGTQKHGLLRSEDVVPSAFHHKPAESGRRHRVEQVLERGRPILVQVTRDAMGRKGPTLTSNLSIAGRYLVFTPLDDVRGVSRKLEDEDVRAKIKERIVDLPLPEGAGVIARTNAGDQNKTALNRDLNALLRLWKRVRKDAGLGTGTRLLYSDQDLIVEALRDLLDASVEEVLVDDDAAYERARSYMRTFMPRARTRLVRYAERMPLFSKFDLERQIESIYKRNVELPSGGSIVIEGTEALTAIDVNSGRATRASSQEETAYAANTEAAREVARQLRLRDIGGLVVVDFIDMRSSRHQRNVEKTLREAMKPDRSRVSIGRISPNGLLEINRQRLKKALQLRTHRPCPTCSGTGSLASPDLVGLNLLRRIETRAVNGRLSGVRAELHPELADAIQNDRRQQIAELEQEFDIKIEIIAATRLHRSEEDLHWHTREDKAPTVHEVEPAVSAADLAQPPDRRPKQNERPATDTPKGARPNGSESGDGDGGSRRSSRRRRPSRRRSKSAVDAKNTGEESTAPSAAKPNDERKDAPPKPVESESGDGGNAAPPSPRKRRPRRRRPRAAAPKPNDERPTKSQGQDKTPSSSPEHSEPVDGGPRESKGEKQEEAPRKRRSRWRRRKKPSPATDSE